MQFSNVALESFGYLLPPEILSSADIEVQLSQVYERLKLPPGRLELMSGIHERRFWPTGIMPSDASIQSARLALQAADFPPDRVGCLIHASVCRDFLEPATASRVHHELGLSANCWVYDVSNACLGILNAVVQIAAMIECGAIEAGIAVGSENARNLVESTVFHLNRDTTLTRQSIKPAFASLTIGSGSCAILVVKQTLSKTGNRLFGGAAQAHTQHHHLCQSDTDQAGSGMQPLMETDSELLMAAGIAAGQCTYPKMLQECGWDESSLDWTVCHQVGSTHRKKMLESLNRSPNQDFATFPWLGNTGSVALPVALAIGLQSGNVPLGHNVGLLGIGSGINCVMLGANFRTALVGGILDDNAKGNISKYKIATEELKQPELA